MWDQTVTVYRAQGAQVLRRVLDGCFYRWQLRQVEDDRGSRQETDFLLVIPGKDEIAPGDRVLEGEGPEITAQDWAGFVPVNVPGLAQVAYARHCRWNDLVTHTEAGRK